MYPFKTLALFPLLELARRDKNSAQAMLHLQEIQKPSQEKLDDGLTEWLDHAQTAFAANDSDGAFAALDRALELARRDGFV